MAFEVIRDFHQLDPRLWEELTREHPESLLPLYLLESPFY
jgi:hypothetical protein